MLRLPSASALYLVLIVLLFPAAAAAQGPLTNGGNHSGSISAPGEIDEWTFTATAGDAILVRIGETLPAGPDPGFWPWIQLLNPSGTVVGGQYGVLAAEVGVFAGLTGTYTVRVASADSGNDALGDYVLRLVKVPGTLTVPGGDQGGPMTNGGNHAGRIEVGDLDAWTFTANQNDAAIVRIGEVVPAGPDPGFWPWIRVYGPNGASIGGQYGDRAAEVAFVAPLTGTYTVVVATADTGYDASGDYSLRLARIPGTFSDENGGTLTNGGNHPAHIDGGDLDVWTFTANQNESAIVRIGEVPVPSGTPDPGFWPWLRVYGPNGASIGGQYGDRAAEVGFVAPLTGTYTVVVATADTGYEAQGDYILRLAKAPGTFPVPDGDQGGALTNGANHPGHIGIGDLDVWTFAANQNDSAIIRIGEVVTAGAPDPGFWPWLRVYGPTGAPIEGQYGDRAAEVGFIAPLTGTYTVVVVSADTGYDAEGDYILRLARIPGTFSDENGGALTNGGNHPGRIEVGDLDTWTFTANQHDSAIIRIGEVPVDSSTPDPGFWPWIRIYGPNGAPIGGQYGDRSAEVGFEVPLTGTYTVVVATADTGYDAEGDYILRIARMPGPFTVPDGDHGGAMINGVNHPGRIEIGDLDMWSFPACLGASVVVTINEVPVGPGTPDPGFWPWIRLYNSAGTYVAGSYDDSLAQFSHTVAQPGTFTLVVSTADSGYDATGDYTVRVQVAGSSCGPPTTVLDNYTMAANTTLNVAAPGVLANDNTNGGGVMTAELVTTVTAGTLVLNANGSFTFTPPNGFLGTTSFRYRAVNSIGVGNTVTVTLAQSPETVADTYATPVNTPLTVSAPGVLANDNASGGGTMTAELVTTVTTGTLALNSNGSFTFTPPAGFSGTTSFTYRAVTSAGAGNTATVTLTVNATVPRTADDSHSTNAGTPLNVPAPGVLANDATNGGGALTAQLDTTTTSGILALGTDGSVSYSPDPGFSGSDSFTYRAVNSIGAGNTARVTIQVRSVTEPQPPTDLYAAAILGNMVKLRFKAPTAGPAPTGYVLEGGILPGQVLASIPTGSTAPIYSFVAPSGTFYVRMHTVAGAARSGPSNEIRIHVDVPAVPSAPADLTGVANGSSIALAWRNTFVGGAPSSVVLDVSGSLSASLPLGLTDSFQFNGVPGGTYTLSVRAVNGAGSSPSSNAVTLTFPSPTCSGAPLPPSGFLAYRIGNTIFVLWDPAATGGAPTSYLLSVSGAFNGSFATPGRTLSGSVGPGTYNLSVAAANACGTSAATPSQTVVVP